jgi:hypothetical protein
MPRPSFAPLLLLAACAGSGSSPSLAERLPGTYTAHESAATITYVVKPGGSATLDAVTNLGERVSASASYEVRGDTAYVELAPQGASAAQSRTWTLHGDSLVETGGDRRTVYVRAAR